MDVEDNENRRLIFIIMKGILTPEEKQYLRRTSNYLRSLGMREGLIEIEMENWEDRINHEDIRWNDIKGFSNNYSAEIPQGLYPILKKVVEYVDSLNNLNNNIDDISIQRIEIRIECDDKQIVVSHEIFYYGRGELNAIGYDTDEDIERIKDIPYAGNPNGGFVLHLPDQERKAKHPITDRYVKVIEKFGEVHSQIQNFTLMCMGTVHESVRHVFPEAPTYQMWSRAGNLLGESMLKPELLNRKDEYKSVYHGEQPMTCGCLEKLYHNIMLPNGDVSLCCMDYGLEHILGNLIEQDYGEIIPEDNTCFNLCRFCENAKKP